MSLILIVMLSLNCGEFNTCAKCYNISLVEREIFSTCASFFDFSSLSARHVTL